MTIQELIDHLSAFDPDTEVRIALQPTWPLAATIEAITELPTKDADDGEDADPESSIEDDVPTSVVWLAAGGMPWSESPYAPRAAWEGIV